jgi:glycogen(starch) synthase
MLGWEYPPHIAGGLGTACAGLTAELAAQGVSIHFIVPEVFGGERVEHMRFSSAAGSKSLSPERSVVMLPSEHGVSNGAIERSSIPAFLSPYWNQSSFAHAVTAAQRRLNAERPTTLGVSGCATPAPSGYGEDPIAQAIIDGEIFGVSVPSVEDAPTQQQQQPQTDTSSPSPREYPSSILSEVEKFTADVVARFSGAEFDIIHAHDWMTFPAGVALAKATKRPLIVHVHSLEHDRSGVFYDESINAIERCGLESADRVIAVSHYTKSSIERYHSIASKKIAVVHNGIYPKQVITEYREHKTWPTHVVLFLGRVTFQKGPEYFVEAARKVIPRVDDIVFVLAGDGDLLPTVKEHVSRLKLDDYFIFPGFVQGEELEELFSVADLYVMPSVSEPFGIAALEAISFETPVLISKQSGVSEVVTSALTVDFWDTDSMADLIINVLQQHDLRQELVATAKQEIAKLHWSEAAAKTIEIYSQVSDGAGAQEHEGF